MPSIRMPEFGRYPQGFEDHGAIRRYLKGFRGETPTAKASIPYLDITRWGSECLVRLWFSLETRHLVKRKTKNAREGTPTR